MKTRKFLLKAMLSVAVSSCLTVGNAALAGELGFGFAPGLVAGEDFVPGQLIVGYKDGASTRAVVSAAQTAGGTVAATISGPGAAVLLDFASEERALAVAQKLLKLPGVAFVERNGIVRLPPQPQLPVRPKPGLNSTDKATRGDVTPNAVSTDPGTGFQYHLPIIRKTATLPALSATPPTVAVLDTGVDYTHPDLAGRVILGRNTVANNLNPFDDHHHGTHVAGIIAAKAANGGYGEGVCPNCKILAVKVLGADGSGSWFDIAEGMAYARTVSTTVPTKVVNMSLGGGASSLIAAQVLALKTAGKVLVAAAGNSNTTSTTSAFPGADPNTALRVMATEQHDCRAWFSNFSPAATPAQFNIAAPGWNIPSTLPDAGYGSMSGTSMASPVVAGAAALLWGQVPTLTRDTLVTRLLSTGKSINCGFAAATKRVDVRKAITNTTETSLIGRLLDPFTGKAPAPNTTGSTAQLFSGTTLLKTDLTDKAGVYELTGLAAGTGLSLKGVRGAYATATLRTGISIGASLVNGPATDAFAAARPVGNATVTLDWKRTQPIQDTTGCTNACNGSDFDLYVKTPAGAYIGYGNSGDLRTTPFVKWPRDALDDLEPLETIVIGSAAPNGTYKVFVDNWATGGTSFSGTYTGSGASVQAYNGAGPIGTFYAAPPATCGVNEYWYVGDLVKSGTNYTWTNRNTCSNTVP
jgi:hypothetical protein